MKRSWMIAAAGLMLAGTVSAEIARFAVPPSQAPSLTTATFRPADTIGFTILYPDYGTTYNGEGTVDGWRWVVGRGQQDANYQVPGGRLDHGLGWSYNVTANGVRARSDEIGILNNQELYYPIPTTTTFNCSGAPVYTAGTYPTGGYSTVTASTTPFTAAMVNTTGLKFTGSTVGYPVVAYTSSSVIRVLGDCSGRTTTNVTVYARGTEEYQQIWHVDDRIVRHKDTSINTYTQAITKIDRFTNLTWQTPVASPVTLMTLDESNGMTVSVGNIYIGTNQKTLYGKNSAGTVAPLIGFDNVSYVGVGAYGNSAGVKFPAPFLHGNDEKTTIVLGNGAGRLGGVVGETKRISFVGHLYSDGTNSPRLYTDLDHITMSVLVSGDTGPAEMRFGSGAWASQDTSLYRSTTATLATNSNVCLATAGKGIQIKEGGTAAKMGSVALTAGAATVSTTAVTASSRIFVTSNADGGTPGWLRVDARNTGSGTFHIQSSSASDTSTVAWVIIEPSP